MRKMWFLIAALLLTSPAALPAWAAPEAAPSLAPDDIYLGKADAPVTIFEYASLTCPHCAEFDVETLPKVKAAWIDTGKAKLVYRDYPLDQAALRAAMLARCAPPDRFFDFIDVLFHNQQSWAVNEDPRQALSRIALLGGISQQQFDACMNDQKLADRIVAERLVATDQYKVDSTPTFFINGKKVVGAQPYDAFNAALTAALDGPGATAQAAPSPAASTPAAAPPAAPASPAPAAPPPAAAAPAGQTQSGSWYDGMLAYVKHWFGR